MANLYEERVWLKSYPEEYPPDLDIPSIAAIDVFENSASRAPQAPAIHYFDWPLQVPFFFGQ